jgi:hypothetical protein
MCSSLIGVSTTEDILVAAKVTNAVFPRHNVRAHSPCNKRYAGAQNRGNTDPVEPEIVTDDIRLSRRFGALGNEIV